MIKRKILVIFAHPAIQKSRVNRELAREAMEVEGVTFHDLYDAYPDFIIDIAREQKLLLEHDAVIFQHPFYWYSTPAIIKEWCDLVLEYGFAYGEGGDKLAGKAWGHAISTGGPESAYSREGYNRFSIAEFMAPLEQSAHLCDMPFLKPFITHGAHAYSQPAQLAPVRARYRKYLESLVAHPGAFTDWRHPHHG